MKTATVDPRYGDALGTGEFRERTPDRRESPGGLDEGQEGDDWIVT
jgi:hypothetical protein